MPGLAWPSRAEPSLGRASLGQVQAEPLDVGSRGEHVPPTLNVSPYAETTRFGVDGWGRDCKVWLLQAGYKQAWYWKH